MLIKELLAKPEEFLQKPLVLSGWIRNKRLSSNVGFIELNDGSQMQPLQVVFSPDLPNYEEIDHLGLSSTIEVHGTLVPSPAAKQPYEIAATKIVVLGESDKDYPLQKKRHTLEFLRTIEHLRPRTNMFQAVFRMRSVLAFAVHEFFQDRGFIYVHTPLITGTDAEGAGDMFRVTTLDMDNPPLLDDGTVDYSKDFFGKETFLTVSGQLAVEPFALAFGKVYTFGPTFRSENSNTPRHASEFWMIEPEMSFCDLECNMQVVEDMIKHLVQACLERAPQEMQFFNDRFDNTLIARMKDVVEKPFQRVTYTEAIEILLASGQKFEYPVKWGMDIQTEHEKYLAGEHFRGPVFVTDYPKAIKSFYMKQNPDGKTVRAMDLLVPAVGEIVGGSEREENYELLKQAIEEREMNMDNYEWYLDLRRFGTAVHSGFGLGFERMLQYVTAVANIRDVIAYPRTPRNANF